MPQTGIEPVREYKSRRILSPVRLPVPPLRHTRQIAPTPLESCTSMRSIASHYVITLLANHDNLLSRNGTNRARTYDPLLVRQMLSQLSYDPIFKKINVISYKWYQRPRRDSNSRPPPWQGGALTNWATGPNKWTFGDSNPGPIGYEPIALTSWAKGPKSLSPV